MPSNRANAIGTPLSPFVALLALLTILLTVRSARSAPIEALVPSAAGFRQSYPYAPISDTLLQALLGYKNIKEDGNEVRVQLLLVPRKAIDGNAVDDERSMEGETGGGITVGKRKNAEMVNHILKNFSSLNRLDDAGRK